MRRDRDQTAEGLAFQIGHRMQGTMRTLQHATGLAAAVDVPLIRGDLEEIQRDLQSLVDGLKSGAVVLTTPDQLAPKLNKPGDQSVVQIGSYSFSGGVSDAMWLHELITALQGKDFDRIDKLLPPAAPQIASARKGRGGWRFGRYDMGTR